MPPADHAVPEVAAAVERVGDATSRLVPRWAAWALQVPLFVSWMVLFWAAHLLEYAPHASLWFPPTALTFAGCLVFGWRAMPAFAAACACSVLITLHRTGLPIDATTLLPNAALFTASHCIAYGALAYGVNRSIGREGIPSIARCVTVFLLGGLGAALLAAVAGSWGTAWGGMIEVEQVHGLVLPWLIGDYAGLVAMGPLLAVALRGTGRRMGLRTAQRLSAFDAMPGPRPGRGSYAAKVGLMLTSTTVALLAVAAVPDSAPLMFAVFGAILLQLWIVHTHGALESLIAIALFSTALAVLVAVLALGAHALTLQFVMITLAAASYFGLSVPMLYADNAQLRRLLVHDTLTGVYSRHFFVDLARQALLRANAQGRPVSLLMIDLDHFKDINDTHGHAVGDRVLADVAHACQRALGTHDALGRLSGDEFCALLPDADAGEAARGAARILDEVRTLVPIVGVAVSVSIGTATTRARDDGYAALLMRADEALYAAKRAGRGRVEQR